MRSDRTIFCLHNAIIALIGALICACSLVAFSMPSFAKDCIPGLPCVGYEAGDETTAHRSTSRACDADFMNQITAKATLEAQREMMVNQSHIVKPDSVLEYSCFNEQALKSAVALDNPYVPILAMEPVANFINKNFNHGYTGGKIPAGTLASEFGSSSQNCNYMQAVWAKAKCANASTDGFLSFEELISTDPRTLPTSCSGSDEMSQEVLDVATNAAPAFKYAKMDAVKPYLDIVGADSCGNAIPTGVKYCKSDCDDRNPDWKDEYVCANPSCYYDGSKCRQ